MQINERRPCLLLGGCCAGRAILGGILFCVGLNKRYRKRVFENIPKTLDISGAGEGIRTSDLLITSQLLYQLSYTGGGAPKERRKIL